MKATTILELQLSHQLSYARARPRPYHSSFLIFPPTWETCRPAYPPPPRQEQPVPRKASETQPNHSSLPEMVQVNKMLEILFDVNLNAL